MDRKLPKGSRDVGRNMYLDGKRKKKKKAMKPQLINRRVPYIRFLNDLNLKVKTWPLLETDKTDYVKNAETAVVNVVREDNDVTLTADQHVVMGNEQNVVDPLRNLDDPAMWPEKIRMIGISPKCIANES